MKTRKNTKSCEETFCKGAFLRRQNALAKKVEEKINAYLKKKGVNVTKKKETKIKLSAQDRKLLHKQCMKGYCNPDCKGTLFEDGKGLPKELIDDFKEQYPNNPKMVKAMVAMANITRKQIFGKDKSVLKNSFYKKLTRKNVQSAKKDGALSGCTLMLG